MIPEGPRIVLSQRRSTARKAATTDPFSLVPVSASLNSTNGARTETPAPKATERKYR